MQIPGESRDSSGWLWALGTVLAAILFLYPLSLGIPLMDPDEGLHASIAQEMVERGDWLIPSLLGRPFPDKPILYFWAEALSLRLWGMHEAAVRLPGLIFGLLGVIATAAAGWRMSGRSVGLLAGVFYATMLLPTAMAQAASHDVALVPWVVLALLMFWESERAASRRARAAWVAAAGLMLGLTCLTKGLAGVALVGAAYGGYLLLSGRMGWSAVVRGAAALAVAGLVASMWYLPAEIRNPGYLRYYFLERHLLGFASDTQPHGGEPWWYYLPVLLGGGLPWIAYLPVAVQERWARRHAIRGVNVGLFRRAGENPMENTAGQASSGTRVRPWRKSRATCPRERGHGTLVSGWEKALGRIAGRLLAECRDERNAATVLLWCWLIGGTLLLSASSSKLITYLWPVFPAVALLAARVWAGLIAGTLTETARRSAVLTFWLSCLSGTLMLPVVMGVVQSKLHVDFSWQVWTMGVLPGTVAWLALWAVYRGRYRATLSIGTLSLGVQYMVVMAVVLPPVAAATSARELADHFNRLGRLPPRVLLVEERLGSLVFYLDPELRADLRQDQFEGVPWCAWATALPSPSGTLIAVPEGEVESAEKHRDLADLPHEQVGRYRLYETGRFDAVIMTAGASDGIIRR